MLKNLLGEVQVKRVTRSYNNRQTRGCEKPNADNPYSGGDIDDDDDRERILCTRHAFPLLNYIYLN